MYLFRFFQWLIVASVFTMTGMLAQTKTNAAPNANNFAYPQSLFVDSPTGHIWVTDFDHHRVMRFDVSTLTAIEREVKNSFPGSMMLAQNYPNPFNPVTQITFSLASAGRATLSVSNLLGQQIAVLFDEYAAAATAYSIPFDGQGLSSGLYLYTLRSATGIIVKRMCIVK